MRVLASTRAAILGIAGAMLIPAVAVAAGGFPPPDCGCVVCGLSVPALSVPSLYVLGTVLVAAGVVLIRSRAR